VAVKWLLPWQPVDLQPSCLIKSYIQSCVWQPVNISTLCMWTTHHKVLVLFYYSAILATTSINACLLVNADSFLCL